MICVTGDLHADISRFKARELKKLRRGDAFFICGDFGCIWDGGKKEKKLLKKLGRKRYNVLFVEGTHENFDLLESYPTEEWCGGKTRRISGNLRQLLRGQCYEIAGKKIFACGGGHDESTDTFIENKGEYDDRPIPTEAELKEGIENLANAGNEVDFIISYEPPARLIEFIDIGTTDRNNINTYFDNIINSIKFKMWFFGKRHINKLIPPRYACLFDKVYVADDTRLPKPKKKKAGAVKGKDKKEAAEKRKHKPNG